MEDREAADNAGLEFPCDMGFSWTDATGVRHEHAFKGVASMEDLRRRTTEVMHATPDPSPGEQGGSDG